MENDERKPLLSQGDENDSYTKEEKGKSKEEQKKPDPGPPPASLSQLFRYATALDKFFIFIGSIFSLAHGAGWPVLSIVMGQMTDTFVAGPNGTYLPSSPNASVSNSTEETFDEKMTRYAIQYVIIGAAVLLSGYLQIACFMSACERQVNKIRKHFFRGIMRQEIGWFDKHQSGELTTRISDDLERVREGIGDKLSLLLQFSAQFVAGFAIGFWKSWKMTLVMMSFTPLLAIMAAYFGKLLGTYTKLEQARYAGAGSVAEEVISCIRTVVSFNGQNQELDRYEKALHETKKLGVKKSVMSGLLMGSVFLVMFCDYGLSFWYEKALRETKKLGIKKAVMSGLLMGSVYLVMFCDYGLSFWYGNEQVKEYLTSFGEDGITPGTVLTVFFCVMIGSFSLGNAAPNIGTLFGAKGAAAVVFEIIDRKPEIDASSGRGDTPLSVQGAIELSGVNFFYPTRPEVQVLTDFNLSIKPGQTVALVGSSGCGKSTIVNLVQRFYDPTNGQVSLDGNNLKNLNVKWLRQNIGVVSQEPVLFGCTIAENIRLGKPTATMAEIEKAAKAANAHDFISGLPKGFDTLVGERGAQLSGGQKQRVAIARALIRDPRILLLDEATSALDSESEKIVQAALEKARLGRTTLVIAHRLSTIQNADIIYVVDKGQIVEQGTHSDLMDKQGLYHSLVTAQTLADEDEVEFGLDEEEEEETADTVPEQQKVERSRTRSRVKSTSSDGSTQKLPRQVSRQMSRQLSVQSVKEKGKGEKEEEVEEEEEYVPPKYFRLLHENTKECAFIIMGCIASAINGCTMPAFAIFFGEMIKVFIDLGDNGLLWSMMFVALGGTNFLTNIVQSSSFGISGEKLTMRLRLKTFQAYLRQDIAFFDDKFHSTGALTTRLATDASMVKNATGIRIGIVVQSVFGLIAALIIAFYYGWALALVVLGIVPVLAFASSLQIKVLKGRHEEDKGGLESAGKTAAEAIENVRTVQALTREDHFYHEYAHNLTGPLRSLLKQAHWYGLSFGLGQGVIFMVYGGAFRFGAWQVDIGEMTADNVFKVFFAIAFTGMVIGQSASFLPDYSKATHAAGLIFKALDTVPPIDVYSKKGTYLDKVEGVIRFKDVCFTYPTRPDVKVLKGVNMHIEPGQTVALVGQSGCGKSTIVSLLQRFYDVESGEVINILCSICICMNSPKEAWFVPDALFTKCNLKDLHLAKMRSFISVVSQEPVLFNCSIRDNIAYGLDTQVGMDDVIEAARAANIHEFISGLPAGYDTEVGEKGTQLSGGQKQRVAIARALIRNPRILLLDEATSALDTESEKLVQEALDKAQEGRTCVVIAHRLSTIQNADVIFVMDNGVIVESGTHQSLLSKKGVYTSLVSAQQFTK